MKTFNILSSLALSLSLISQANALVSGLGSHRVELTMTAAERELIKSKTKTEVGSVQVNLVEAGRAASQINAKLQTRGLGSIKYPRKNFELKALDHSKLTVGDVTARKLILSAGAEDPLLTKNMLVYRIYDLVGIPTMTTGYTEVLVNGVSQGLYMTSEHPDQHLIKDRNADIAFRRGYDDRLELREVKSGLSQPMIANYEIAVKAIFKDAKKLRGEELLQSLNRRMNFDHYLRLLAVNYLVRNGDYFDELYLFGKQQADGSIYFDVFPWDLDNSFETKMHLSQFPGHINNGHSRRSRQHMMFSFESQIDRAISQDSVLLNRYFEVLGQVAAELTEAKLDSVFAQVDSLLKPYVDDQDVLFNGLLDLGNMPYTKTRILGGLQAKREFLRESLTHVRSELEVIKREPESRASRMNSLSLFLYNLEQKITLKLLKK